MTSMTLESITEALTGLGLIARGAFHPEPEDAVPLLTDGRRAGTVVIVGNAGPDLWRVFTESGGRGLGAHPMNAWTEKVIGRLVHEIGATAWFPFHGPPYHPFQRWAGRAETVWSSPLGILIHPEYGLWHAYRAAIGVLPRLELPPHDPSPLPCDSCVDKPCLNACPVHAFTDAGYDVAACRAHVSNPAGEDCLSLGCRARRACPVGAERRYEPAQAMFHMQAFLVGTSA